MGQTVLDRLELDGLRPAGTPYLYVTSPPMDCCPGVGDPADVYVWVDDIHGGPDHGGPGLQPYVGCGVTPIVTVKIRAAVCWPIPEDPTTVNPATFDTTARWVTQAMDSGLEALRDLVCQTKNLQPWGVRRWWVTDARPIRPAGGCTGVVWSMSVSPNGAWPAGAVIPAP